jgi:type II secretory pathway pseudopilin PulG
LEKQGRRRGERGFSILSVIVATAIISIAGIAILGAMGTSFKAARSAEPRLVGQTTVSNLQTDLNALAMYDPTVLSKLQNAQTINVAHGQAPSGATLMPADTQSTTLTVEQVTTSGTSGQLVVNYQVPSGIAGTPAVTGNATVTVRQKAPSGCDPNIRAVNPTAPGCS